VANLEQRRVILDYASSEGLRVRGVKAILFQSRLEHLRAAGLFEAYVAGLPLAHRDDIVNALASTWVPVDAVVAHYEALESLKLSDAQLKAMTDAVGTSVFQTMFAAFLRMARNAGVDGAPWAVLKQADRIMGRLYQGGGLLVTQVGPKDAHYELIGLPFAESRIFRIANSEFLRGVINLTAKACIVRELPSSQPRAERFAVAISWV
jgi:hypothetical protein